MASKKKSLITYRKVSKSYLCAVAVICIMMFSPETIFAALPPIQQSKIFDFTGNDIDVIRESQLQNNTVMQSFGFDNTQNHIYIVQLMSGGQQLPDEKEPVPGAERDLHGDLTLTKLDLDGEILGHMYLRGFGHGVSIGVEPEGGNTFIWMETDAVADDGMHGWGTKLGRFSFKDGEILDSDASKIEKFDLVPGADRITANLDFAYGNLTLRYRKEGAFKYAVYPLEQIKRQSENLKYVPDYKVEQPNGLGTFQGFVSYGRYLYLLEGNAYGKSGSDERLGNTYITTVDLQNGKVMDQEWIFAGKDLLFREPEGMGIHIPDPEKPGKAILNLGFASTTSETNSAKLANVYGFDSLVTPRNIKGNLEVK